MMAFPHLKFAAQFRSYTHRPERDIIDSQLMLGLRNAHSPCDLESSRSTAATSRILAEQ
jgi:hypothetical protein